MVKSEVEESLSILDEEDHIIDEVARVIETSSGVKCGRAALAPAPASVGGNRN